ncbi:hypothetical protein [Paenibacillus hexagrammi]|uniref:Uncharacterized protein n=1 Tax=Paenibacillus hexagrammi TaxID=2908839 RepID=A0ABY3SQN5_9BACL|nr:hypothetical protein [Paenibacillus sp. YPD9-1]UJF35466.1 hypothetical protein L0M14_10395 [Paenibacillus sp. YPD9-1]
MKKKLALFLSKNAIPLLILASFISFFAWWGKYFSPKTNVGIVFMYIPVLIISVFTLFFVTRKKWSNIVTMSLICIEFLFFIVQPYYAAYEEKKREPFLASYLNAAYPGEHWTIDYTDHHRTSNNYHVVFDNEKDITYLYHVDKNGTVTRTGYSGSKPDGDFKHYK